MGQNIVRKAALASDVVRIFLNCPPLEKYQSKKMAYKHRCRGLFLTQKRNPRAEYITG